MFGKKLIVARREDAERAIQSLLDKYEQDDGTIKIPVADFVLVKAKPKLNELGLSYQIRDL